MSSTGSVKFSLHQKPNSRERVIFFAALFAFGLGFFKTCVMESNKAISALQEELDKAVADKAELLKEISNTPPEGDLKTAETIPADQKINWIGKKESIDFATDSLIQAAQDDGVVLLKISLPAYKEKQNYWFRPVSLTLAGNLSELGHYLEHSEQLKVPFVIERITIEPNDQFADIITLRMEGGFYATK